MLCQRLPIFLSSAAAAVVGWWMYGCLRTMAETVGFSWSVGLSSAGFTALIVLPFIALIGVPVQLVAHYGGPSPGTCVFGMIAGLAIGCVAGEALVLYDEEMFHNEVADQAAPASYGRVRMWPNEGCSLLYNPQRGYWATE